MKLSNFRKCDIIYLFTYVIDYIERKHYKSSDKIELYFFFMIVQKFSSGNNKKINWD